tara:strand:+ start:258 stop:851 length:594 start_codon:yes stop_codon:yes gene_type:complete
MKKTIIFLFLSISISQEGQLSLFKSILLPGWGQFVEKDTKSSKQFIIQESVLWISLLSSIWTKDYYEQTYITFAKDNAGIDLSNSNLDMAVDVGNYLNLIDFNENKQRRREFDLVLNENNINNHWQWNSESNRRKFKNLRINAGISKKIGSFVIGGLIGHRIISAIHLKYIKNKNTPRIGYSFSSNGLNSVKIIWNF